MKEPATHLLENCDPDDVSDALVAVQRSLGIEYAPDAFDGVKTFGQLCDVVAAAVRREHREGCTAQQAFYKLRRSIANVLRPVGAERGDVVTRSITVSTPLAVLFPSWGRRSKIQELQGLLGVRLELLGLKAWVGWAMFGGYLAGFLMIFVNWRVGVAVLGGVGVMHGISLQMASQFTCSTVGDAARLFARDHYRAARRDPDTVNRAEIVPVIKAVFARRLALEMEVMTPEATLGWAEKVPAAVDPAADGR